MDISGYKYHVLFFPTPNNMYYTPVVYNEDMERVSDVIYLGYIQQLKDNVSFGTTITLPSTDMVATNSNWLRYVPKKGASSEMTLPLRLVSTSRYTGTVVQKEGNQVYSVTIHTSDITDAERVKQGMIAVLNNTKYAHIMQDAQVVGDNTYKLYLYCPDRPNTAEIPINCPFHTVDFHGEITMLRYAYRYFNQIANNNYGKLIIGLSSAFITKPDNDMDAGIVIAEGAMFESNNYEIRKLEIPHCVIKNITIDDELPGDIGLNYKIQIQAAM